MTVSHGFAKRGHRHPLFNVWVAMHQRCTNSKCKSYPRYGGRGIRVCDEWTGPEGFSQFIADMGEPPKGMSLDRIDNDGHYCPSNCRWASRSQQQRNRSADVLRLVTIGDETLCLSEWADRFSISIATVRRRIDRYGWDDVMALTTPINPTGRPSVKYTHNGMTLTLVEWSEVCGIPLKTLQSRMSENWTIERAISQPVFKR